ncbi:MAG: hypothetical protein WKF47_10395 [Geodermatophilaceae bacterium]
MIDVRNPEDGFAALRARIDALGEPVGGDRGEAGEPLTVGEWALLIEDIVEKPDDATGGIYNVATPEEDDREYDAIFVGGGRRRPVRGRLPVTKRLFRLRAGLDVSNISVHAGYGGR